MPLPNYLPLISQLCIHINNLSDDKLKYLINFIEKNNHLFISPIEALKFENNNIFIKIENQIIMINGVVDVGIFAIDKPQTVIIGGDSSYKLIES